MIRVATVGTSAITERFVDAVASAGGAAMGASAAVVAGAAKGEGAAVRAGRGIRVDTVYSRDATRARDFADRLGVPGASDDLDALLASGEIDAVYIGSPNGVHAAQARAAIAAGIHVFLEKPATPTSAEFEALVGEARAAGIVLFEGMRNVYDPGMARVAELLPEIGPVRLVSFGQSQYSARYDLVLRGETPNIFDPALAGGALFDLGVYPLSALIHLFGAPDAVTGDTVTIATGADGAGAAVLSYPNLVAQVSFSKIGFSHRPNEIQGEGGTIEIDEITAPREIAITLRGQDRRVYRIDAAENNMVYEVLRFAELVRGDADPTSDQDRTLAVLRAVEQIRTDQGSVT